ncbi:hypothetical protein [Lysobacter solisilvae (ex Woo and Kim 2020)]|uniref:Uncharacterized protein n=1 Tax=Agrilutibacter terrestris TaxID=2865112 RepID=A0A7H0G0N8_9GAMM|nr:hypothetical protein [Lysobacter terrestris]QNP41854.1 hypothetical protein H8B22_06570 [Lysobacter terrestris]
MIKAFVLTAGLLLAGAAWSQQGPVAVEEDGLVVIVNQQRQIKADLDDGGIEGLTPRQNGLVRKAQAEVFVLVDGKSRLDELSIDEKVRLDNALERINALVVNTREAGNKRDVCWRERVSGTTVKKTRCGTEAEMREAREGARDFIEKGKVCGGPGCG